MCAHKVGWMIYSSVPTSDTSNKIGTVSVINALMAGPTNHRSLALSEERV